MGKPIEVSDSNFEETVLKADLPAMVDFWAPWCGPCRMVAPIVEELAEEYGSKMSVAKLNVDVNPVTASKYGIRSIPTLLVFKQGKPIRQIVGLKSKAELKKEIDSVLG